MKVTTRKALLFSAAIFVSCYVAIFFSFKKNELALRRASDTKSGEQIRPKGDVSLDSSVAALDENMTLPLLPRLSAPALPRDLNKSEHLKLMALLRTLDSILTENHIPFVMFYGTLMGSYLMHDVIPWDDDADMIIPSEHGRDVTNLLKAQDLDTNWRISYILYRGYIKAWIKDSPLAGRHPWGFPFVDITFYRTQCTASNRSAELRLRTWSSALKIDEIPCGARVSGNFDKKPWEFPLEYFYPLHRRPFGGLWLLAPNRPQASLREYYGEFTCRRGTWNHRQEMGVAEQRVPCDQVRHYYPHVFRTRGSDGGVIETVKVNGTTLYSVSIREEFKEVGPYSFEVLSSSQGTEIRNQP